MTVRVFISYSHDSQEHMDRVWELSQQLRRDGVDCRIDQQGEPEEGWPRWSRNQVQECDFVLVVITDTYLQRYEGKAAPGRGLGSKWEGFVISQELYEAEGKNKKFLPMVFLSSDKQFIPIELRAFTYYELLNDSGYEKLFRRISNQPERVVSPINPELRKLSPRVGPALSPIERKSPSPNPEPAHEVVPEPRVLDAAIPSHIVRGVATELLVLIRLPKSNGLEGILQSDDDAEAKPEDVRSKAFDVFFPLDSNGRPSLLKTTVKVTSPDFSPGEQSKNLNVPPDRDSDIIVFLLTPTRVGRLLVLVELQWEDISGAPRRLRTECIAEASGLPGRKEMNVCRLPISVREERSIPGDFKIVVGHTGASSVDVPVRYPRESYGGVETDDKQTAGRSRQAEREVFEWIENHSYEASPSQASPPAASPKDEKKRKEGSGFPGAPSMRREPYLPDQMQPAGDDEEGMVSPPRDRRLDDRPVIVASSRDIGVGSVVLGRAKSSFPILGITAAVLTFISTLVVGYWQFVKPGHKANPRDELVRFYGEVLNSQTKTFVPDALVTIQIENGSAPLEAFTDTEGKFSFTLPKSAVGIGTQGKVSVRASGFDTAVKYFPVDSGSTNDALALRLEPAKAPPDPTKGTGKPPVDRRSFLAGRVIDSKTGSGLAHASISVTGMPEGYLTDDTGNFQIDLHPPLPSGGTGVRVQISKEGCKPVDKVVARAVQEVIEMSCAR